jgi:hypothetical protein
MIYHGTEKLKLGTMPREEASSMLPISIIDPNENIEHQSTTQNALVGEEICD